MHDLPEPLSLHPDTVRTIEEIRAGAHNPLAAVEPGRSDELIAPRSAPRQRKLRHKLRPGELHISRIKPT